MVICHNKEQNTIIKEVIKGSPSKIRSLRIISYVYRVLKGLVPNHKVEVDDVVHISASDDIAMKFCFVRLKNGFKI